MTATAGRVGSNGEPGSATAKCQANFERMQWIVTDVTPPATVATLEGTIQFDAFINEVHAQKEKKCPKKRPTS